MAYLLALRSALATRPWRQLGQNGAVCSYWSSKSSMPITCFGFNTRIIVEARDFHLARPSCLNCSCKNTPAASTSEIYLDQGPPHEAALKAISEVPKTEGRIGQTTNVVNGGSVADTSDNEWLDLDQKVNSYPMIRGFIAIGIAGDGFVQAMVNAVESVIQQKIPEGHVRNRVSSRGKYVSVNIGPVQVVSSQQVRAIYNAMMRDDRIKYFL